METETTVVRSGQFDRPIRLALMQQVPIAILCLLMLDFGVSARICAVAMIGFWSGVLFLMARRHAAPSKTDLVFVQWGFIPILLVSILLGRLWVSWH
jgi:hypothetical protein